MASRLLTFVIWALVAGSGLFWGLKLFVRAPGLPAGAQTAGRAPGLSGGGLSRVLGNPPAAEADEAPQGPANLRLLGVVAPRDGARGESGLALIAVGDQPARAWRTGAVVDGELVLLSVTKRAAQLGPRGGPATTELKLPEPAAAATGDANAAPGVRPLPTAVRPGMPAHQLGPGAIAPPAAKQGDEDE